MNVEVLNQIDEVIHYLGHWGSLDVVVGQCKDFIEPRSKSSKKFSLHSLTEPRSLCGVECRCVPADLVFIGAGLRLEDLS